MRIPCKTYSEISVPCEYRIIARDLSNNRGIISLQQDKGRGVVRINSENTWINVFILNTEQLIKYRTVQPVILKRKFKRNSRKIKQKVPKDIYTKVYPTGSSPAKFCGTSKIHKLPIHGTVDDLPLQPIISNVKIATYQMALYLAKLLSSLSR